MIVSQVILSIFAMVLQNCLFNNVCKKELKTSDHVYRFNILVYLVCAILFGVSVVTGGISLFTVALGLVFGVVTALSNFYRMQALSEGPMHITLLVTTSSMIIPTMSGVFFGEKFSVAKLIVVFVLIGFIYLSLGKSDGGAINKRWIMFCALAFVCQGSIGVLQKIHQSSVYKGEINVFLFVAFMCSLIYSRIRAHKTFKELGFTKKYVVLALVCGLCSYAANVINLKLSGILPSQLFFPLVNGSSIVLSSLASVLIFRERLTKKQSVGLIGGIASLILICVVG